MAYQIPEYPVSIGAITYNVANAYVNLGTITSQGGGTLNAEGEFIGAPFTVNMLVWDCANSAMANSGVDPIGTYVFNGLSTPAIANAVLAVLEQYPLFANAIVVP